MKIALLKVSMAGSLSSDAMEPLAFAVLKALTPDNIEIIFYDERIEVVPDNIEADWVLISAHTFTIKRAYQWCQKLRSQNVKVAIGGFHVSMIPEEAMQWADTVFVGDGEAVYPMFISDLLNNQVKSLYQAEKQPDIWHSHYDYTLFKDKKYPFLKPLQYSRGCKYSCDFCSIYGMYKSQIRYRDPQLIVQDIKQNNIKYAFFVDDNLYSNKQNFYQLLAAIKPLNIKWACQISIDITADDKLLQAMVEAGCIVVLIGFETLNPKNLVTMNKAVNYKYNQYSQIIDKLKRFGLLVYGTFVIGYDDDDTSVFKSVVDFALDSKLMIANFNPLIPTVGTPLYQRLKAENRLLYDNWWLAENYKYGDTVFIPKKMSATALAEGCSWARKTFYSHKNIIKRFFSHTGHLKYFYLYLATNYISKREINNKQGRSLSCTSL